ncbi:MAG: hypothetical protein EBZ49_00775 [Proteobacteria bacterium]|nr:hypothetical protein [Pseudomonadota bacterium]
MSLSLVLEYIKKERENLAKDEKALSTLSKISSAPSKILDSINLSAATNALVSIQKNPLEQLGKDYISEMISKNGAGLIKNVDTFVGKAVGKQVENIQNLAFDTIAVALVAKNDLSMYFLKNLAKNAVSSIQRKRTILLNLQEKLRQLHNALLLLVNGEPYFSKYLVKLRNALLLILTARNDVVTVRNTLFSTDRWLGTRFEESKKNLKKAEDLMQPADGKPPANYTDKGILSGLGITPPNQQLAVLLAVPQLVQEVLAAANGYFLATLQTNALISAFLVGYASLSSAGSSRLKQTTINTLDNIISKLDGLVDSMSTTLNGEAGAISTPVLGFSPDPIKSSAKSLEWLLELKTIIQYMGFVPSPTLKSLTTSNDALTNYQKAVDTIKKKNNRELGGAILIAKEGQEQIGQLESQLTTFTLACLQAIVDAKVASNILSLGRTIQNRLTLSLDQDKEIEVVLTAFANSPLPLQSELTKVGTGVFTLLNDLGLDRAAALLQQGKFSDFFNLNPKTATFVGAALVGIGALQECLHTTEDRQQLVQAQRELQRAQTAKELLAQRAASTGFAQQKASNTDKGNKLLTIEQRAVSASSKCATPDILKSDNLLAGVGATLGIGFLGGKTLPDAYKKIGSGALSAGVSALGGNTSLDALNKISGSANAALASATNSLSSLGKGIL